MEVLKMSRVISILSKNKDQLVEYKRIQNEKFDKKIANTQKAKEDFNVQIDARIAALKD